MRILATLALLMTAACGTASSSPGDAGDDGGTWHALPPPPLSPRLGAVTAWTGTEALFLGGDTRAPCPPTARCVDPPRDVRDGAAFTPRRSTWRRTAPAPAPIEPFSTPAVIGDEVFLRTEAGLQSYDASEDAWTQHHATVGLAGDGVPVAHDGRVVVVGTKRRLDDAPDAVYDPGTGRWSALPRDPLGPAFDRKVTSTPAGLVLTAHDLVAQPGSEDPSVVRAAVLRRGTDRWDLLADSDQLGGWRWVWTGERLVDPTLGGADGGETNGYGRTIPYGGVLDPATGRWGRLPDPPEERTGGWTVEALTGPLVVAEGWVYDDRDRSWTRLTRPAGAPSQPGSAVWAGDRLIVLGGLDTEAGYTVEALSSDAWSGELDRG